jgi:F-type H+-transporting ATPase subunit a
VRFDSQSLPDTLNAAAAPIAIGAADTAAVQPAEHGFDFAYLLNYKKDSNELKLPILHDGQFAHFTLPSFPPVTIGGIEFDLSITKHVFFLLLAAFLLVVTAIYVARHNRKNIVPKGIGNLFEAFIVFIRDEIAIPNMGPGGVRYLPYLLTTFFFILLMNLLGLVPFGATATSNVSVTGGLALTAFVMIQLAAIRAQGLRHYLAHLTGGVHPVLWPIMIPIEIIGLFTKPFALCIRLFANMTGGHIVILSLIGLIFIFQSWYIAPVPVLFALGITMLEIFIAFLQAYVFTMLTSLFMGLGMQTEGHGGHEQAH